MNIKEWVKSANKWFRANKLLEGETVGLHRTPHGIIPYVKGYIGSAGSSSEYNGPFAVVKKTDTSVTVWGETSAGMPAYCILGLSRIEFSEADVSSITSTGWIYLEITYAVSAKFATSLPAQDNTHIYHPIAHIVCADSKISSITQLQYGCVHFPARAL